MSSAQLVPHTGVDEPPVLRTRRGVGARELVGGVHDALAASAVSRRLS